MRHFFAQYIDAMIPLAGGILVYLFPRTLTKLDLSKPENKATAEKAKWIVGCGLIAIGLLMAVITTLGQR
jgi:Na+-driven multidrug efflux pump